MNSREKGKRGERQWRDELRDNGFAARRGQQFSGSAESPDVVCDQLSWIHFEVKAVERLNIEDAMDQARRDGSGSRTSPKVPIVAHKRNFRPWLVTMDAQTFFRLLRGDIPMPTAFATFPAVDSKEFETAKANVANELSSKNKETKNKTEK